MPGALPTVVTRQGRSPSFQQQPEKDRDSDQVVPQQTKIKLEIKVIINYHKIEDINNNHFL